MRKTNNRYIPVFFMLVFLSTSSLMYASQPKPQEVKEMRKRDIANVLHQELKKPQKDRDMSLMERYKEILRTKTNQLSNQSEKDQFFTWLTKHYSNVYAFVYPEMFLYSYYDARQAQQNLDEEQQKN